MNKQVSGIQLSLSLQLSQNLYLSLSHTYSDHTLCTVQHQLHDYATEIGVGNFTSTPLSLVSAEDVLESLKPLQKWIFQPPEIWGGD
jgi:hypothetical protein